jgi:hypothetical protein
MPGTLAWGIRWKGTGLRSAFVAHPALIRTTAGIRTDARLSLMKEDVP